MRETTAVRIILSLVSSGGTVTFVAILAMVSLIPHLILTVKGVNA